MSERDPVPRRSGRARFYHDVQLRGPVPSRFIHQPNGGFSPSRALIAAAETWARDPRPYPTTPLLREEFQRFTWVRLLAASANDGQGLLHRLLELWLSNHGQYGPAAWRVPLTAARLIALFRHVDAVFAGTDGPFREQILDTAARQARHLSRSLRIGRTERDPLAAHIARTLAALSLPTDRGIGPVAPAAMEPVLEDIASGSLPKRWRNLDTAAREIDDLVVLSRAFRARALSGPSVLDEVLKVGRLFLGGFFDPTGAPVLGPGHRLPDPQIIARINPVCRRESGALLAQLGYGRLQQESSVLTIDLGSEQDHAGASALSFTANGVPLITQCGKPSRTARALNHAMGRWAEVLSVPGASSTVDRLDIGPAIHRIERAAEGSLLTTLRGHGTASHVRRLFLSRDGQQLLGEDELPERLSSVALRFHLPTGREASIEEGEGVIHAGDTVLARFSAEGEAIAIEESISALEDGTIRPALQFVIRPEERIARWRLVVEPVGFW